MAMMIVEAPLAVLDGDLGERSALEGVCAV